MEKYSGGVMQHKRAVMNAADFDMLFVQIKKQSKPMASKERALIRRLLNSEVSPVML